MELIVFDLDGTLLNERGRISEGTGDTLAALAERGVAYTVATGRSLHASRNILSAHAFHLPHVLKNGVMIWDPRTDEASWQNCLTLDEIEHVMTEMLKQKVSPFVSTIEPGDRHGIYHPPIQHAIEKGLADYYAKSDGLHVAPLSELPADADIVSISAIGASASIRHVETVIGPEPHLLAYAAPALEGGDWRWIDIHHTDANKGGAVLSLKRQLGASRVVCFGDGTNDISMFEAADESYAPENAEPEVKKAATAIIGHHDEDGIAEFLRERFDLPG
ncbi:MAG: HAD family hydrolase [Woeseiaceae bacterium]|nr:HAD family hydrolase [Woeseiaceae bacterium]